MEQTSGTFEEIVRHQISAVIAKVLGKIRLPVSVGTDFKRNRSDTSLFFTLHEEFFGPPRALAVLPFLRAEITEFVLTTTSTPMSASVLLRNQQLLTSCGYSLFYAQQSSYRLNTSSSLPSLQVPRDLQRLAGVRSHSLRHGKSPCTPCM